MGRFYKTAKPTFVDDIMYKAPYQILFNALQAQDKKFEENIEPLQGTEALYKNQDFIDEKDGALRQKIIQDNNAKILELAEKAKKNPALAGMLSTEINTLRKKIEDDVTSGQLFQMDREAKRRNKVRDFVMKRKDITEEQRQAALNALDRNYKGVGQGNYADNIHIYEKVDEDAYQKELRSTIMADSEASTTVKKGEPGYLVTEGDKKVWISKKRVRDIFNNDPTVERWKQGTLQTLERQLQEGKFLNTQEMYAEYEKRLDNFRENTIGKIAHTQSSSTNGLSSDASYNAKQARALAWEKWQHQLEEEDAAFGGYGVELQGEYSNIPDNQAIDLTKSMPMTGYGPAYTRTPGQAKRLLEGERVKLNKSLKLKGISEEEFLEKMKTDKGRLELTVALGANKTALARQANYIKSKRYEFKPLLPPDYKKGDHLSKVRAYQNKYVTQINNLTPDTKVKVTILNDAGGVQEVKNMTLAEAKYNNYVSGQTSESYKDMMIPDGTGWKGTDGSVIMIEDEKTGESRVATKEEAEKSGRAAHKQVKVHTFDAKKPLLNVNRYMISESEDVDYKDGTYTPTSKKYVDIHSSTEINGRLHTVLISVDKDNLKVKEINTNK